MSATFKKDIAGSRLRAVCLILCVFFALSLFGCSVNGVPGSSTEYLPDSGQPETDSDIRSSGDEDTETSAPVMNEKTAAVYKALEVKDNQFAIIYDLNGGNLGDNLAIGKSIADSATGKIRVTGYEGCFTQVVTDSHYICPHSMGDKGYLSREGFVLYGYNTEPDGTGEYFGCGWNVPVELGCKRVLYAMWAKASSQDDFKITGRTVVTSYSGNDKTVVIPEGISRIYTDSFKNNSDIETLILPKTVKTIDQKAFNNCPNLKTVYMYDLITEMSVESFNRCNSFDRLYINNANNIKYLGGMKQGSYMCKFQRLKVMENQKKIVLIGGSNLCYGLDSAMLKDLLKNEFEIVNWGTMYYLPTAFFVDVTSQFMLDGDIVVMCPEEEPAQWGQIWSGGTFNYASYLFYSVEGCMEVFSYVDMVKYRKLLPSIAKYNGERVGGPYSYESFYDPHSVNQYGDFDMQREQTRRKSTDSNGKLSGWPNTGYLSWIGKARRDTFFTKDNVSNLNSAFDLCIERGARVFISFSVTDEYYFSDTTDATVRAYETAVISNYVTGHEGVSLISSFKTYLFDDSKFYNSMHHLLWDAAQERTRLLYKDISEALAGQH